jgi:hypothetical protein
MSPITCSRSHNQSLDVSYLPIRCRQGILMAEGKTVIRQKTEACIATEHMLVIEGRCVSTHHGITKTPLNISSKHNATACFYYKNFLGLERRRSSTSSASYLGDTACFLCGTDRFCINLQCKTRV